jgi:hypothetical protein
MTDPFNRPARPWDLFNKNLKKVESSISEKRLSICRECPQFLAATTQCKECGCIMKLKTKLPNAECPLHKWGQENIPFDRDITQDS